MHRNRPCGRPGCRRRTECARGAHRVRRSNQSVARSAYGRSRTRDTAHCRPCCGTGAGRSGGRQGGKGNRSLCVAGGAARRPGGRTRALMVATPGRVGPSRATAPGCPRLRVCRKPQASPRQLRRLCHLSRRPLRGTSLRASSVAMLLSFLTPCYRVVKTIKGHRYLYDQQTYREGGQVHTLNRYIGRADSGGTRLQEAGEALGVVTTTPLFNSPGDFARAVASQFDAPRWGEVAREQLFGLWRERRGKRKTAPAPFNFGKSVSYDEAGKKRFHARARVRLAALAGELGLMPEEYDLRSNMGGIAVSGEVTLHSDNLYVQVSQGALGNDSGILYRRCAGRSDFHGGVNHFAPLETLNNPVELGKRIREGMLRVQLPLTPQDKREGGGNVSPSGRFRVEFIDTSHKTQLVVRYFNSEKEAMTLVDDLERYNERQNSIYRDIKVINTPALEEESARATRTTRAAGEPPASPGIPEKRDHETGVARPAGVSRDVQTEITSAIIEAIEKGRDNGTFQMPWRAIAGSGLPLNAVTHKPYHGINALYLSVVAGKQAWRNEWASFQQWKERGASVRRGEHGTPVVFYSQFQIHDVEEDENGNKHVVVKSIPVFRYSTVFNMSQVDNPPVRPAPQTLVDPIENVEKFIAATKSRYKVCRRPRILFPADYPMPVREAFTGSKTSSPTEAFYSTILHELCHWTGGKSRLNRDIHNRFGDGGLCCRGVSRRDWCCF